MTIRWGIIGPGNIAAAFAAGLATIDSGILGAIAGRDATRRNRFGDRFEVPQNRRFDSYEALVADADIDAVYVATPHPWHAEHSILALQAGKHVLCEKPAGMTRAEVQTVLEVATAEQRFFMEAFMYRSHPQIARLLEWIDSGRLGDILHVDARFCFDAKIDPGSRLFDRDLGGGAILDVGCYPASLVRLVAGAVAGGPAAEPLKLKAIGRLGRTGVDEETRALMSFASGLTATCHTAITRFSDSGVSVQGSKGTLFLDSPWLPGDGGFNCDASLRWCPLQGDEDVVVVPGEGHLYAHEIDVASRAIAAGLSQAPPPAFTLADSLANAALLDRWRAEIGYVVKGEVDEERRS